MTSILCLAHYCDMHGPTPLMVTEGLPVPCTRCYDDDAAELRRRRSSATSSAPKAVIDSLKKMNLDAPPSSSALSTGQDAQPNRAASLRTSGHVTHATSSIAAPLSAINPSPTTPESEQTPPQSPRKTPETFPQTASYSASANALRRDPSFRRTYDENVTKRASPCANCALTLPKRQEGKQSTDRKPDKPNGHSQSPSPTLRTRTPYARVYGSLADASPPSSNPQSSYPSDDEDEKSPDHTLSRTSSQRRPTTSNSQSSSTSKCSMPQHTHYLDYTSTHEPTAPSTYSIVRASCLRTLSFETLPRRPEGSQPTTSLPLPPYCIHPPVPYSGMSVGPGYITSPPTPQSASSGGPIFFGDPSAGYTTAYIFRIPDMHARGRKRVYAFLALSTHRERLAMKAFSFISVAFRDLAAWIQELAEAEAEREREREEAGSAVAALNAAYSRGRGPHDNGIGLGGGPGGGSTEGFKSRERDTTSFLTGGGRGIYTQRMGGSMGPGGFTPKARGLAELVGLPDFFLELHTRFVHMLLELGVVLGS